MTKNNTRPASRREELETRLNNLVDRMDRVCEAENSREGRLAMQLATDIMELTFMCLIDIAHPQKEGDRNASAA